MKRRNFISGLTGVFGLATLSGKVKGNWAGEAAPNKLSPLPQRPLGKTGAKLSILGLGGVVLSKETPEEAQALVREAIEHGVNYFDVAPSYGNAEDRMGPALAPYRKNVFLACKTQLRDAKGAEEELNRSLQKLQTDHFDLYQLHALKDLAEVDQVTGPGGALETFTKARKEGKVRFIGFSAHSSEAALKAMDSFAFDTILFPVNFVCFYGGNFGPEVIQKARDKGMGILALKMLARMPWENQEQRKEHPKCWYRPVTDPAEAELAMRFTLSQPVTAAVPPGDPGIFRKALAMAHSFVPLDPGAEQKVRALAAGIKPIFSAPPRT